jgi:hypothetical protein
MEKCQFHTHTHTHTHIHVPSVKDTFMLNITYLPEYKDRFFPIFAFDKLGVVLNSHTKENIPAELMLLRRTVNAATASAFFAWFT